MPESLAENWLLLRGLSRESAHWGDFLPALQAGFPAAKLHTLDLPGTGSRFREASPGTIEEITQAVRLQAEEQGLLRSPLILLGLSLGGMVAWEWMLSYPEDIAAGFLINTSQASLSPFYQRLRWQSYPALLKLVLESDYRKRELAIMKLVLNHRNQDQQIAQAWQEIQSLRPVRLKNSFRQILAAAHYRPLAEKPKPPILLLNSRGDRLVTPACSDAIGKRWQLPIVRHPWAGHDLTTDDCLWVVNQLQLWQAQGQNQTGT